MGRGRRRILEVYDIMLYEGAQYVPHSGDFASF